MDEERATVSSRSANTQKTSIYDTMAAEQINEEEFLGMNASHQRLALLKEIRATKLAVLKVRQRQHKSTNTMTKPSLTVTKHMKQDLKAFIMNTIMGNIEGANVRDILTKFPFEAWGLIMRLITSVYIKSDQPSASKWRKCTEKIEECARSCYKAIRVAFYKIMESIVQGKKGKEGITKVIAKMGKELYSDCLKNVESSEPGFELKIFTRFGTKLLEGVAFETRIIEMATRANCLDVSKVVACGGDILEAYLKFKELPGWKISCQKLVGRLKRAIALIEISDGSEDEINGDMIPHTQAEFAAKNICDEEDPFLLPEESEEEELEPKPKKRSSSQPLLTQKRKSKGIKRRLSQPLPQKKKKKLSPKETDDLIEDLAMGSPPPLEDLTQVE